MLDDLWLTSIRTGSYRINANSIWLYPALRGFTDFKVCGAQLSVLLVEIDRLYDCGGANLLEFTVDLHILMPRHKLPHG
jgi:hypothetical protein